MYGDAVKLVIEFGKASASCCNGGCASATDAPHISST